jgi:Tol biopolymer transport system component
MTKSRAAILVGVLVILALLAWPAAAQAAHVTERVSVSSAEAEANGDSDHPSVSTDGRYIAFHSAAPNLVAGDTNGRVDVFLRDRVLGTTIRVSVSDAEAQSNGDSGYPSISADGRYIAFESVANNLVTGDTNGRKDVFVRDRVLGTTIRVSRSTGGTQGNADSQAASISASGRYVAFHSLANNLVGGDTNGTYDVFVRDTSVGATTRASLSSAEAQANSGSMWPSISADGRYVAIQSDASNLVAGDTNAVSDIFVRDRTAGTTARVSLGDDEAQADDTCGNPSISATGRWVAFDSYAKNLVPGGAPGFGDVYVRDTVAGTTQQASVSTSEVPGDGGSYGPQISANGRYTAFYSLAANLTADSNLTWDIFLRDRESGTTLRTSVSTTNGQANDQSGAPAISVDGRTVAFRSDADNLVVGDTNGAVDVFAYANDPSMIYKTIRGSDRYDTAIKVSQAMFPGPLPAGASVVLAPGNRWQDCLCAAPLATVCGGPLLLTPWDTLLQSVKDELLRLDPESVYMVGGLPLAMQEEIDTLFGEVGFAGMLRGWDEYNTAYRVAEMIDLLHGGATDTAVVTRGDIFPDALGVAPMACYREWPILFTDSATGALQADAANALSDYGITKVVKVGTYATLPAGVTGLANLSGADRYTTNKNVAEWAKANAALNIGHLGIATGDNYPDALAAGPYMAQWAGILLLSPLNGPLPTVIAGEIYANRADVDRVTFFAMIEPVISLVKGLLP